jgi:hypothetical protein
MAWVATAIVATTVGTALIQSRRADIAATRAKRKAKKAAVKDRKDARMASAFADTEGKALGDLGVIDLSVDDELDESQKLRKKGRVNSTLSI